MENWEKKHPTLVTVSLVPEEKPFFFFPDTLTDCCMQYPLQYQHPYLCPGLGITKGLPWIAPVTTIKHSEMTPTP